MSHRWHVLAGWMRRLGPTECRRGYVALPAVAFVCESRPIGTICSSGQVAYTWDAENRLVSVAPVSQPVSGDHKVEFKYDYMGRRVEKDVYTHNGSSWGTADVTYFVWYNWLMIAELKSGASGGTGSPAVTKRYVWGLDLAGQNVGSAGVSPAGLNSLEAAGGIGGLLSVYDYNGTSADLKYVYCYDANGNVTQLLDPAATTVSNALVARYEYDPYGSAVVLNGTYATSNRWRFSTKTFDAETELGYWGYRYYLAVAGRWIGRDPNQEIGGTNLYGHVRNAPNDLSDPLGLQSLPANGDRSKACCRYDTSKTYAGGGTGGMGVYITHHRWEKTSPCNNATKPEDCCDCCPRIKFTAGIGYSVTEKTTLLSARWGACCACTVQQRRMVTSFGENPLAWIVDREHSAIFVKCSDGTKYVRLISEFRGAIRCYQLQCPSSSPCLLRLIGFLAQDSCRRNPPGKAESDEFAQKHDKARPFADALR